MKKLLVIMLVLFLAVPAVTYAGSVTSRYDVTLGGYVKFDMGYNTKGAGADFNVAPVSGRAGNQQQADQYGNFFAASGETNLNVLIKGPDGWGAKTSAYVEGDFFGAWASSNYGLFTLRHAWMKLDWGNSKLTIGQQWQGFGLVPTYGGNLLGFANLSNVMKGTRQPQIVLNTQINKNWAYMVGIMSPASTLGVLGGNTTVNQYTRSGLPFAEGELTWSSDACGKIGPWQMLFGLGGYYGSVKQSMAYTNAVGATKYADDTSPSWAAIFKGYIPIIPEKKGNKTGALSLSGAAMMGQNWSWMNPGPTAATFSNVDYFTGAFSGVPGASTSNLRSASPTVWGGWAQLTYFFTDKLFVNGYYSLLTANVSNTYRQLTALSNTAPMTGPKNNQMFAANIMYDVNAAMRVGFEWSNVYTRAASLANAAVGAYDTKNTINSFRIGAYYFF
jgi:hypothetical protein